MPCRVESYKTERGLGTTDTTKIKELRRRLKKRGEQLSEITNILCETCTLMEENGDSLYFRKNPQLKAWWENHKEEDRKRREKEERDRQEAKEALEYLRRKKRQYFKLSLEPDLDPDDQEYFQKKMSTIESEAERILGSFPELRSFYTTGESQANA